MNSTSRPDPFAAIFMMAFAVCLTVMPLQATVTLGTNDLFTTNSTATGDLTTGGSITASGNITATGWGKFNDGIDMGPNAETSINWLGSKTTAFDITEAHGVFLWRDAIVTSPSASAKNKMQIDADNSLTLYKTDGVTAGIILAPNSGKITLPAGSTSGIYFGGNSNPALKADANGAAIFSSKVLFENGADFGSGNTLNASNVQYLRSTLANLGYSDTPSNATPISGINTSGSITINKMIGVGNFLYAVGYFRGSATIGSAYLYCGEPGMGGFVAKCSPDGSVIWAKQILSSTNDCEAFAVAANAAGQVASAGRYSGVTNFFGAGKEITSNQSDGYVAVYNSTGDVQWARTFGGNSVDFIRAVAIAGDGSVAAGATFDGSVTSQGATNLSSVGSYDSAVILFSSAGGVLWAKQIGSSGFDQISSVTIGSTGNVTASGRFNSAITTLGTMNINSAGSDDGYLVQFNGATGQPIWSKALGGVSSDSATGHIEDSFGNIFVHGMFHGATTNLEAGKNKTGPSVPIAQRLRVLVTGGADSPLAAWSKLKNCVAAGDFEAAGECLSESHRDGLKAMMIKLGPELAPTMLNDFGQLQQIALYDDVATYAGDITTPEGVITFLASFIREDGAWKIFSF